jgi:hypothetical protein
MSTPKIPTPEPADNTLTPGDRRANAASTARDVGPDSEIQPSSLSAARRRRLASAARDRAVTPDVTESPEVAAEPLTWPAERPPWWPEGAVYAPGMARRIGIPFTPPVTRASGAHLEPVGQHELDDDAKIPEFLRQHGVTSLATHAQPIASDRVPSEGSQADQPSGFVRRILREAGLVTFPVTPSQAPPASVTPTVTAAPVAGSVCPTCNCRVVPARLSAAERQRAYRRRKREQGQGVAKGD